MKVWIDGHFYSKEEAKISVFDHGLLYGDGIFEGIRIYNKKVFKLKEHIRRLYMSAQALMLEIPMTPGEMETLVEKCVAENKKENGYIRLIVTRGTGDLGLDPAKCSCPSVIIITADITLYPEELYRKGIPIITSSLRRSTPDTLDPRIKSLNYLNNIQAKIEARHSGCIEAVMLNRQGFITECTADNVFIILEEKIFTPCSYQGILKGITRDTIIELAETLGLPLEERPLTPFDLYTADECFLTGSGAEVIPVTKVDGRTVGTGLPGPLTEKLRTAFRKMVG